MPTQEGDEDMVTEGQGLDPVRGLISQLSKDLGVPLELFDFDEFDGETYVSAIGPIGPNDLFELDVRVDLTISGTLGAPADMSASIVVLWGGEELKSRRVLRRHEEAGGKRWYIAERGA